MAPINTQFSNETMKSCLTKSLKFGTSLSVSNANNHTNIFNAYTPTSNTTKANLKNHLLAKKCL